LDQFELFFKARSQLLRNMIGLYTKKFLQHHYYKGLKNYEGLGLESFDSTGLAQRITNKVRL
jgi:hypothetical protein